ncbi:MAG: transcription antitermination factor NusB [Thiotrichales bacterium]
MANDQLLFNRRHVSRKLALQALYQWQITRTPLSELLAQFRDDIDYRKSDQGYFEELVRGVLEAIDEIDQRITPFLAMKLELVDMVERAILRIAVYELMHKIDLPYRVVLSEAITLARQFGAEEGFRFVNGVLDKMAAELRPVERT